MIILMHRFFNIIFIIIAGWLLIGSLHLGDSYPQEPEDLGLNWKHPAYDIHNTGFNPQEVITRDKIDNLELKWIYQAPDRPATIPGARVARGIHAPPIVVNGILYFVTESNRLTALNTLDGKAIWTFQYDLHDLALAEQWSYLQTQNSISFHDEMIWMQTNDCNILAFEPLGGEIQFELKETCVEIPGNDGTYVGHYSPTFFETILITRASAGGGGGRGFVAGYDSFNGRLLWRWFAVPQSGGDLNWDFADASKGNIEAFRGDWGENDLIGGGSVFSLMAVDEERGIIYLPTGAPGLSYDASLRPGPNLYSDSIIALDAETGEMIWYHQTTPHDINGHEPTRNIILTNADVKGNEKRIVIGVTRADFVYILDAKTGELLHNPISFGGQKVNAYNINQDNEADFMLSQEILVDEVFCPGQFGGSSTVSAVAYNTLYVASQTFCSTLSTGKVPYKDRVIDGYFVSPAPTPQDSSVSAIDISTGTIKWTFKMDNRYQGGITVSGGVVYLIDLGGNFYALDANDGKMLKMIPTNGGGNTAATIASNARGEMTLFIATGGSKSGVITALGISEEPLIEQEPANVNIVLVVLVAVSLVSLYLIGLRLYNRK